MPRNRQASLEIVRVPLSEGDWIDVKRELCVADGRKIMAARLAPDARVILARWLAWIQAWSFVNGSGEAIPLTADGIDALALDELTEVGKALDAHEEAMEAEKNATRAGRIASAVTSSSPASSGVLSATSAP